jgi:hypothetical protein
MLDAERFVLPFKWREFGKWFSALNQTEVKTDVQLNIEDIFFEASEHKLEGISVTTRFCSFSKQTQGFFLITFLADMRSLQLFEPFIGNPDCFGEIGLSGRYTVVEPMQEERLELFIPDQGWILPSIWRFLVQSVGLRKKTRPRMPDILVIAFSTSPKIKFLCYKTREFDYFGNANRLKDEIALRDFFRLLNLEENASESDIQRAYIAKCRELQPEEICNELSFSRKKSAAFTRIKNGYQLWTEKLRLSSAIKS